MKKTIFSYILNSVRHRIIKEDITGDTIQPKVRLAICLSRIMRGEYFYNIAKAYGVGKCKIGLSVGKKECELITF